jgi:hypothetical protein
MQFRVKTQISIPKYCRRNRLNLQTKAQKKILHNFKTPSSTLKCPPVKIRVKKRARVIPD